MDILQQRRKQPHISPCRCTVYYSVHTERVYTEVCSATLKSSWDPGFNSSQKTTDLQVFSEQRPCCATLKQHLTHITFYHHPRSHFIAWVRFWQGWRHTKSVEGGRFLEGRGQDRLCRKILGQLINPDFPTRTNHLEKDAVVFFPNCVYHQSHRALYCQSSLLCEGICKCVLGRQKQLLK